MKKVIASGALCALMVLGGVQYASAETTTPKTQAEMLTQIQELMKLIASLQEQIRGAKAEIQELAMDLDLGAENEDVRKAQEILATDSSIFGAKPTGYFGPLTKEALKKFQERYGLEVTGKLDEATREVMKELRKEKVGPGLIKSDVVKNRIKVRLQEKWGNCELGEKFRASECVKGKDKNNDDEEDDSSDEDTQDATRVEAEEALGDAREAISDLKLDIEDMKDEDADEDEIDDAKELLLKAQKKLAEARRAFVKREFDDAVEKAEEVVSMISADDEDDADEADDEDEDSSDDEDDSDEDDDSSDEDDADEDDK